MEIIMFMAMSLNGIIARKNHSEDFLSESNWNDLVSLAKKAGFLVWGRKTYEIVKSWEPKYLNALKDVKIIVVSSNKIKDKNIINATSPDSAVFIAKKSGAKKLIVSGGSSLNSSFLKKINKIILNIEPKIIGTGISLVSEINIDCKLKLETISKKKGILQLTYDVLK